MLNKKEAFKRPLAHRSPFPSVATLKDLYYNKTEYGLKTEK